MCGKNVVIQIFFPLVNQEYPTSIHITAVLTKYETRTGRTMNGVATSWLKNMVPNGPDTTPKVPMYVRKSQFRLPFKASTPVVMIGPGTGLAPFRGFIQERNYAKQEGEFKNGNFHNLMEFFTKLQLFCPLKL